MTTLLGDNLHAQKLSLQDMVAALNTVKQNQPTLEVVMDNFDFAKQIQDTAPNCIVVHRDYMGVGGDDNLCQKISPADWLTLQRNKGDFRLYRYTCNESGWNQEVIDWHIKLIKLNALNPVPLRLCILNLGIGQPKPEEWAMGKELLQLVNQYRAWCIIGLHEYAGGIITSGFIGGAPDDPRHTNFIPVENWPVPSVAKEMTMWHMGRFKFLNLYCNSQSILLPRVAITEFGFDHLGDIETWLNSLQKTAPYISIRGWKSLKNQWEAWFKGRGWSPERAMAEMYNYASKAIYEGTNVIGVAIYCAYLVGTQWDEFDNSKAEEFQKWRTTFATTIVTTPPPVVVPPVVTPPKPKTVNVPLTVLAGIRSQLQGDIDVNTRYIVQMTAITKDMQSELEVIDALIRKALET